MGSAEGARPEAVVVAVHVDGGNDGDIMAKAPIQLTGSIAPGASMVFSEDQKTLAGTGIKLPKDATSVRFTVTSAKVGMEGIDTTPVPVGADAGANNTGAMTP